MTTRTGRLGVVAAAALVFGLAVSAGPAFPAGEPDGTRGPPPPTDPPKKKKKQEGGQIHEGVHITYQQARALIIEGHYAAGIAAMRALGHDDNPEVANYIGYASRKLGRYDESKVWYERALIADPKHTRTWQYYGMWHLEQGNRLKAEDHLAVIKAICGTECHDYQALKEGLEGNISY